MVLRKLGLYLMGAAAVCMIAGCSANEEQRNCEVVGAGLGALAGAGIATAVILTTKNHGSHEGTYFAWGIPAGLAGGGLIGGAVGHFLCPPPPPPPPPPPEKLILRGVHFDFNKYNIRPQDAAVLDEAASILKEHGNVSVNVNGYCDAIGSVRYNLKLSERRADAVVRYLADHGVAESRLSPHGYGKTNFVATNKTAEGRAQNRRVELIPNQ